MICTVLGARGFIGRHISAALHSYGFSPYCPDNIEDIGEQQLGIVFYCIGITADFRDRPLATVEAHVCLLNRLLHKANFERMIYLSSTRIYSGVVDNTNEDTDLQVNPNSFSDLYNLSKIMGESVCLHSGRNAVVARLSNVVGFDFYSQNFLFELIRSACDNNKILLRSAPESSKDYISLEAVVSSLIAIATHPSPKKIYNIASGRNITNLQICEMISSVVDCTWEVLAGAPQINFPVISIANAQRDLGLVSDDVLTIIKELACQYMRGIK